MPGPPRSGTLFVLAWAESMGFKHTAVCGVRQEPTLPLAQKRLQRPLDRSWGAVSATSGERTAVLGARRSGRPSEQSLGTLRPGSGSTPTPTSNQICSLTADQINLEHAVLLGCFLLG